MSQPTSKADLQAVCKHIRGSICFTKAPPFWRDVWRDAREWASLAKCSVREAQCALLSLFREGYLERRRSDSSRPPASRPYLYRAAEVYRIAPNRLADAMAQAFAVLYPPEDPTRDWDSSTIEDVSRALTSILPGAT